MLICEDIDLLLIIYLFLLKKILLILRVFLTCVENKKELKKCQVLPSIKKDLSEKIVELLQYNKLLTEFIFYLSEINYLSWFVQGEQHSVNWSNQAFHIEFIIRIKECFGDNILPINMKKTFLKNACLKEQELFLNWYNACFW